MTDAVVVHSIHHAGSGTWTHLVVDPAQARAAIIDAVLDFDPASGRIGTQPAQALLERVRELGVGVDWILETHAHADHLTAGAWLRERLGAPLAIGAGIAEVRRGFRHLLDPSEDVAPDAAFDRLLRDGDTLQLGALEVRVIATPGHTPDGVAYHVGDAVFVGDTLFAPGAGSARCDFPGGSAATLYASIRRLYALPDATRVYLCHDYPAAGADALAQTTIGDEKRANTQLREDTSAVDYIAVRERRDATLPVPKLLWPAIQFNLRGGRLPPADANGHRLFKLPVAFDA